jgi:hypothetical protein
MSDNRDELTDAAFLRDIEQAGPQAWRELCLWFINHPERRPVPPDVVEGLLHLVLKVVPTKKPPGKTVANLVKLCLAHGMTPTEAYRHVAKKLGPMMTEEAVRKDYSRHSRRKG